MPYHPTELPLIDKTKQCNAGGADDTCDGACRHTFRSADTAAVASLPLLRNARVRSFPLSECSVNVEDLPEYCDT